MSERPFKVHVEYDGGIDPEKDSRIFAACNYIFNDPDPAVTCDGGCMLIGAMTRDHTFYFRDEAEAFVAEQELQRISGLRVRAERKP
jgi:hypothetical protein